MQAQDYKDVLNKAGLGNVNVVADYSAWTAANLPAAADGDVQHLLTIARLCANNGPKLATDAIRKYVRSLKVIPGEAEANAAIQAIFTANAGHPSLLRMEAGKTSLRGLLNFLYLRGLCALVLAPNLAMAASSLLVSRLAQGSMEKWLADCKFTLSGVVGLIEAEAAKRKITAVNFVVPGTPNGDAQEVSEELDEPAESAPTAPEAAAAPSLKPEMAPLINGALQAAKLPSIEDLLAAMAETINLRATLTKASHEQEALRRELAKAKVMPNVSLNVAAKAGGGALPAGKMEMVGASKVFKEVGKFDLPIPMWTWDSPHPDVPAIIPDYVFRKDMLLKVLPWLTHGDTNAWLKGHTGSGKTTFIEQIAARLNWPVLRIAFDSALDRAELVGRLKLKPDGKGGTADEWLPGVLERALPNNYILLCDELDAGRVDALYTLQPVFEHRDVVLLEDGGRRITYGPMTRVAATGNTAGAGDSSGLYPACRVLSAATMDRFNNFVDVPYLSVAEERSLIGTKVGIDKRICESIAKFAHEMRVAFTKGEMPVSFSPRRSIAFARTVERLTAAGTPENEALGFALHCTVYDAAPPEVQAKIVELATAALGASVKLVQPGK